MALSANELRIGNYIQDDKGNIEKVYELSFYIYNTINSDYYEGYYQPIPLTEEWFLKLGAEKDKYGDLCIIDPTGINTAFYLVEGFIQWTKDCISPIANFEHVKYVHQFQNLYFIKTDKELKMINTEE